MDDFIDEVRKREFLWDRKKIPLGRQQQKITDKLWQEVADACNISKSTAKIKWRSLRDQFLKELKKVPVYNSGENYYIEEPEKPKWTHFNSLIFLLNTHTPRKQVIDIKPESIIDIRSTDSTDNDWDESKSQIEDIAASQESPVLADTYNQQFPSIRKVYTLDEEHELANASQSVPLVQCKEEYVVENACDEGKIEIEYDPPPFVAVAPQMAEPLYTRNKRRCDEEYNETTSATPQIRDELYNCSSKRTATELEKSIELRTSTEASVDNENLLFFRSLLPYMNRLDIVQQLRVRTRFQEILMDELGAKH
ncbi:uncharacterized protein LOC105214024 [Zeugodacus cucurbitae]|uniref:uncharacterized protein LOC105214024 n=1 Tax=Zeugodacus cucurbitae TaxID=28588 RepID=UPI0023D90EB3|nr:uncharacterized protein LOC105214024 [Zeugodacus cucurbitae]